MSRLRGIYKVFIFIGIIMITVGLWNALSIGKGASENPEAFEVMGPKKVNVILQLVYVDGEQSEERIEESISSMEDFWSFYEDWSLIDQNEYEITFRKEVNDISPLLKLNGYFGLTEENVLSIYKGEPDDENIIHSFFQIDTAKLKSWQHKELKKGIPVDDINHYHDVLHVFGQLKMGI